MENNGTAAGAVSVQNDRPLEERFRDVRAFTEFLCRPLETEDYVVQTMPDVSPTKWHLAHTSWFFEAFLLSKHQPEYASPHPLYNFLFNSYYVQIGERFHRPHRGLLSRPTVEEVYAYRMHVDQHVLDLLRTADEKRLSEITPVIILGLNHEQQHQELLLTDIKHVLSVNPLRPVYRKPEAGNRKPEAGNRKPEAGNRKPEAGNRKQEAGNRKQEAGNRKQEQERERDVKGPSSRAVHQPQADDSMKGQQFQGTSVRSVSRDLPMNWIPFDEGLYDIGFDGAGFAFDNEGPRHREYVQGFRIASRLVTAGEFMDFIADGGYRRTELWLSDGAAAVAANGWTAPLYWEQADGIWRHFTLCGFREVDPDEPVTHLSLYEADAYARWAGARLPGEAEWEIAAMQVPIQGNLVETETYHPAALSAIASEGLQQMYGDAWEWTRSPYAPYPGYVPPPGAVGEYNGKFMSSQMVLRGGSCATSRDHVRPTYRNFFPPDARWQFSGLRLAQDEGGFR
jgi:formylglycine-generating enzyme required for sulfatase activity